MICLYMLHSMSSIYSFWDIFFNEALKRKSHCMGIKKTSTIRDRYAVPANFYEAVYRLVVRIPSGRVMSYGQIATLLGTPRAARAVGYAMRACPEGLPWQRVINAQGKISIKGELERPMVQRMLLEAEGVIFNVDDACSLEALRWEPRNPEFFYYDASKSMPFK